MGAARRAGCTRAQPRRARWQRRPGTVARLPGGRRRPGRSPLAGRGDRTDAGERCGAGAGGRRAARRVRATARSGGTAARPRDRAAVHVRARRATPPRLVEQRRRSLGQRPPLAVDPPGRRAGCHRRGRCRCRAARRRRGLARRWAAAVHNSARRRGRRAPAHARARVAGPVRPRTPPRPISRPISSPPSPTPVGRPGSSHRPGRARPGCSPSALATCSTDWQLPASAVSLVAFNKRAQEEMRSRARATCPASRSARSTPSHWRSSTVQHRSRRSHGGSPRSTNPRCAASSARSSRSRAGATPTPSHRGSKRSASHGSAWSIPRWSSGATTATSTASHRCSRATGSPSTGRARSTSTSRSSAPSSVLLTDPGRPSGCAAGHVGCCWSTSSRISRPPTCCSCDCWPAPSCDVFGVGDDDQTIYGYNGADPAWLIDFGDLFPGAGDHPLEVNYRCPDGIVDAADRLLRHNRRRVPKTIRGGTPRRSRLDRRPRRAQRPPHGRGGDVGARHRCAPIRRGGADPGQLDARSGAGRAGGGRRSRGGPASGPSSPIAPRCAPRSRGCGWRRRAGRGAATISPRRCGARHARCTPTSHRGSPSRPTQPGLRRLAARLQNERDIERVESFADDIERMSGLARRGGTTEALLLELRDRVGLGGAVATLDQLRRGMNRAAQNDDLDGGRCSSASCSPIQHGSRAGWPSSSGCRPTPTA